MSHQAGVLSRQENGVRPEAGFRLVFSMYHLFFLPDGYSVAAVVFPAKWFSEADWGITSTWSSTIVTCGSARSHWGALDAFRTLCVELGWRQGNGDWPRPRIQPPEASISFIA
ncbi:MAG: hypothetical protein WCH39_29405, partial [Schlesneria sp.]